MEVATFISLCFSSYISLYVSFSLNGEGGWPSVHLLRKKKKNGGGHLPIPLKKNGNNGGGHLHNPLKISKKNGCGHLPSPLRKNSKNGGGQGSLLPYLLN